MSKSLGNGVDPRDIIRTHSADALRFVMASIATATQDVRLPLDLICPHTGKTFTPEFITTSAGHVVTAPVQSCPDGSGREMATVYGVLSGETEVTDERPMGINSSSKFDLGRNFATKLFNATRFALSRVESPAAAVDPSGLGLVDRWMLHRLRTVTAQIEEAIAEFQVHRYAESIYDLVWRDFCDWYLESIKPTVADDPAQQQVLRSVLDAILRLVHPLCPFVTETLHPHVRDAGQGGVTGLELASSELLAEGHWPRIDAGLADPDVDATFERLQALVNEVRRARAEQGLGPRDKIDLFAPAPVRDLIDLASEAVHTMLVADSVADAQDAPDGGWSVVFEGHTIRGASSLGAVDLEAEAARLTAKVTECARAVEGFQKRLANPSYVERAPEHVVNETRQKLVEAEGDLEAANAALLRVQEAMP